MENAVHFYQNLPGRIDPVVFAAGPISVRWYALMYVLAFLTIYILLIYRIKKKEFFFYKISGYDSAGSFVINLLFFAFWGMFIGGRLGYVFFYDLAYYAKHPWEALLPIQIINGNWHFVGYYGMSYFGGLVGIVIAGFLFARVNRMSFHRLAEFVVPAVPAGYFWGRIGNFLNGELYGRATEKFWGMYFSADAFGFLRHPSQLYEAFFEGLVLFTILWLLRNNKKLVIHGLLFAVYLFGYGFFRFWIEFWREPDSQNGLFFGFLSLGQIFSLCLMLAAILPHLGIFKSFFSKHEISK